MDQLNSLIPKPREFAGFSINKQKTLHIAARVRGKKKDNPEYIESRCGTIIKINKVNVIKVAEVINGENRGISIPKNKEMCMKCIRGIG